MVEQAVQTVPVEKTTRKKSLTGMPQQGREAGRMQRGSRGPQTQGGAVPPLEFTSRVVHLTFLSLVAS